MEEYITLRELIAREPDDTLLGTIAGSDYHEIRHIIKTNPDGTHQIVGRAHDWPIIRLRAENAELAASNAELSALLAAATKQVEQADALIIAAQTQIAESEARAAALRAELDQVAQGALIPPQLAAAATGLATEEEAVLLPCPEEGCAKTFKNEHALQVHVGRAHKPVELPVEPPARPPVVLTPDVPNWRCATCQSSVFTRSLRNPDYCQRCATSQPLANTNGHAIEAAA